MKNIELTKDHKSKLLEMCRALFPEYENIFLGNSKTIGILESYYLTFIKDIDTYFYIHWFEFCMTHLSTKIDSFRNDSYLICYRQSYDNAINVNHPIDYLYEEFKKLK